MWPSASTHATAPSTTGWVRAGRRTYGNRADNAGAYSSAGSSTSIIAPRPSTYGGASLAQTTADGNAVAQYYEDALANKGILVQQ